MNYTHEEFQAEIIQEGETFVLQWNDLVINAWREEFTSMAFALMRLGLLIEAVKEGKLFANPPQAFANDAQAFMLQQLETGAN